MSLFSRLFPRRAPKVVLLPFLSPLVRGIVASMESTPEEWEVTGLSVGWFTHKASKLALMVDDDGESVEVFVLGGGPEFSLNEVYALNEATQKLVPTLARLDKEKRVKALAPVLAQFEALGAVQDAPVQSPSTQASS